MSTQNRKPAVPLTEGEITARIREIAVARGLSLPETEEEVEAYERLFADEIEQLRQKAPPSLDSVLAMAKRIQDNGTVVLRRAESEPTVEGYALAARNGNAITDEIKTRMDDALAKAKRNRKGGDV